MQFTMGKKSVGLRKDYYFHFSRFLFPTDFDGRGLEPGDVHCHQLQGRPSERRDGLRYLLRHADPLRRLHPAQCVLGHRLRLAGPGRGPHGGGGGREGGKKIQNLTGLFGSDFKDRLKNMRHRLVSREIWGPQQ